MRCESLLVPSQVDTPYHLLKGLFERDRSECRNRVG
jgi:hypothetical protein